MIMSAMREKTKIVLFVVLLAFVGFIFFDWGMNMDRGAPNQGTVGKVNGEDISADAYRKTRQQVVQSYESRTGRSPEEADTDAIDEEAWIALIRESLLKEQVEKYDITISDAEILELLRTNPPDVIRSQFANDKGEFDVAAYQRALADPSLSAQWANVEEFLRATLPADKLQNYVSLNARVTTAEVRERFAARNEKLRARYVVSSSMTVQLPEGAVTEENAHAYYDAHKDEFKVGEQAVLEFVRVSKLPSPSDSAASREDLEKVRSEILAGADFEDLARTWSDDPSGQTGGDVPAFGRGDMVPELERVAFATPVGQVSEVFATPFGYHIVKVEERKMEAGKERVHLRHILVKVEPSSETLTAATRTVEDLLEAVNNGGKDFIQTVDGLGLKVEKTPPFERGGAIPGIGMLRAAERFAFANSPGAVTKESIEDQTSVYAFRLAERRPAGIAAFEDVKERVMALVADAERKEIARKRLDDVIPQSNGTLEGIAKAMGASVDTTGEVTRESFVPGVGRKNAFVATAFALEVGKTSGIVESDRGFYVLQVSQKTPADEALFGQQKDEIRRQLLQEKRQLLVTAWLETLVANAEIVDFRSGQGVPWKPDASLFTTITPVS